MVAVLLIVSVFSTVLYNIISNFVCKRELKAANEVYRFNFIIFLVCTLIFAVLMYGTSISPFTVILAVAFGVVTALSGYYKLCALTEGPMHITGLITTSSMIIPTMSGVFFGEKFSLFKLMAGFVLIGFIYLSMGRTEGKKVSKQWLIYCALAFVLLGAVGVIQKFHQTSIYRDEISAFLFISFVCSMIVSRLRGKSNGGKVRLEKREIIFAVICGICTFSMNYLNLKLSGILPSQLFFPLVNGSAIVLSSLAAVLVFGEKLSRRQFLGLAGGILSLIAICLVP